MFKCFDRSIFFSFLPKHLFLQSDKILRAQQEQKEPATPKPQQTLKSAFVSHMTFYFLPITYKTCGTDATDEFLPPPLHLPLSPTGKLHTVSDCCVSRRKKKY